MTPTLAGRWQTRLLLYLFVGLPVTWFYAFFVLELEDDFLDPFVFLTALFIVGFLLDLVYNQIQRFRWDGDWPFAFFIFFGICEFLITLGLLNAGVLDPFLVYRIDNGTALIHFCWVLLFMFLAVLAGVQVFYIRWRFRGGAIGRFKS
jgi:hypothetical protein